MTADGQHFTDAVRDDVPGAREIGFAMPARYNASRILFDNLTNGNAGRIALHAPSGALTYAALAQATARAGNALAALGLARGERVLLFLNDTPAYPAFFFGAVRAGLVPVLTNTLTPPDLIAFYLADAGARALVIDAALTGQLTPEAIANTPLEYLLVVNGDAPVPHARTVIAFDRAAGGHADRLPEADTHRDDMAFWMYSSGSTGRPKGIVHLQHDMAYTAESYARHILKLTPDDICFSVPKIFFAYGLGNSLTFPFAAGAASVLHPGRGDAAGVFETIKRFRPTVLFGLPTVYTALVKAAEAADADLSSLRLCISAAEILSGEVSSAWTRLCGQEIVEGLGSTEMLHIYLSNSAEAKRLNAAGRRVPGYEVKLIDRDGGDVADGQEGILCVRGHSSAPLYWNRADKTAETMRDDWIHTGDRFLRDGDGFYYFRGRTDDLIKVSGQWVYPLEVELCLADHPAVREVCVLGLELPDRRMTLKAFVVPMQPLADQDAFAAMLRDHVKQKLLPYKYPRIVEFLAELPKTGTGKIDRQALTKRGL
jgi:benzoate-CoA ligase family protein